MTFMQRDVRCGLRVLGCAEGHRALSMEHSVKTKSGDVLQAARFRRLTVYDAGIR